MCLFLKNKNKILNFNKEIINKEEICCICLTNKSNVLYRPCGHLVTCNECNLHNLNTCPICREHIIWIIDYDIRNKYN